MKIASNGSEIATGKSPRNDRREIASSQAPRNDKGIIDWIPRGNAPLNDKGCDNDSSYDEIPAFAGMTSYNIKIIVFIFCFFVPFEVFAAGPYEPSNPITVANPIKQLEYTQPALAKALSNYSPSQDSKDVKEINNEIKKSFKEAKKQQKKETEKADSEKNKLTANEKAGIATGSIAGAAAGGALAGTLTKKKETEKAENEMADYINSWTCFVGGMPLSLNDNREFSLPNVSNKFIELQMEYQELQKKLNDLM